MRTNHQAKPVLKRIIILLVTVSTLIACQSAFFSYRGKMVAEESRIAIEEGGPHKGVWETNDFTFNYTYTRKADRIEISGELALDNYISIIEILDYLFFRVNFIDSDGKLQDSKVLWSTTYNSHNHKWFIKREIELPSYANAIGFSYMGSIREGGGQGLQLFLWFSPLGK